MGYARALLFVATCLVSWVGAAEGSAQVAPSTLQRAEALFSRGKASMAAGEVSAACAMFGESYTLDPATGSLLALALCHEREGKLASALREYTQVIERPNAQARPDRLRAARERVQALQPVVPSLTIVVSPQVPGTLLEVQLNGQTVPAEALGRAMAVDGGVARVTASAPGTLMFAANVTLAARGGVETVVVPVLAARPASRPLEAIPIVRPMSSRRVPVMPAGPTPEPGFSSLDWALLGTVGAGLVTLTAGSLLTLRAIHDNNVVNSGCDSQGCADGTRNEPLQLGLAAKTTLAAGAILSVGGATLLVLRRSRTREASPQRAAFAAPWAMPHAAGATVLGRF